MSQQSQNHERRRTSFFSRWEERIAGTRPRGDGLSLHLIVDRVQEMIETIDADEAEPRIFEVGDDEQRDGERRRKDHHMEPAAGFCCRHAEACKQ